MVFRFAHKGCEDAAAFLSKGRKDGATARDYGAEGHSHLVDFRMTEHERRA